MVADPTAKLAKAFGVYLPEEGVALRGTFIIDAEGIVQAIEINSNSIGRNALKPSASSKQPYSSRNIPDKSVLQIGKKGRRH
jgi:hypothetical protein